MIDKDDLKHWNDFLEGNFKKKPDNIKLSENSKIFLRKIKKNIKENQDFDYNYSDESSENNSFVLKKDTTLGIDANSNKKLTTGKYKIDSKIDLHGLTLDEAYNKTKKFFDNALSNNYKCILIITGKGLHSTGNTIKENITKWLQEPFFSNKIIKYTDASLQHGGSGAIYILLKSK